VELNRWTEQLGEEVRTFTYDGDTPQDARKSHSRPRQPVITNPDMLHAGILPHHTKWQRLFENLATWSSMSCITTVASWEATSPMFCAGSKRVARFYGSTPQFICTSATIANPQELAARILEEDVRLSMTTAHPQRRSILSVTTPRWSIPNWAFGGRI